MRQEDQAFWGKYRGEVTGNVDPLAKGRVQVSVPELITEGWALPCAPGAGPDVGLFAIPPVGASVWVEFEGGQLDSPIYCGGYWEDGQTPVPPGPDQQATKAWVGETFRIEIVDAPGKEKLKIELTTATGVARIETDGSKMELDLQGTTITLDPVKISLNGSNLEVLK
jgi:uncharacterized protein involved in type VI secretion and phage assembly